MSYSSDSGSGTASPCSTRASSVADDFWVHPTGTIEPANMKLSIIDQCVVRCWSSYVLSFPVSHGQSFLQIYQNLSDGLARTLVQFPFLAGRISFKDITKGTLELNIREDAAVRFNYRDISAQGVDFAQLEDAQFPPSALNALDVAPLPEPYPLDGSPVFVAQANFVKGGLLLFFAHSHQAADATGTSSILKTWASHTAAAEKGDTITISASLRDVSMDRSRLDDGAPNTDVLDDTWATGMEKNASPSARKNSWAPGPVKNNPSTIWYVRPENLQKLKEVAYPKDGYISTCDALAALLWRQVSKARELSQKGIQESRLYFVCDVRSRLSPPIRKDATCNATMKMFTSQTSGNFDSEMSVSLQEAAVGIREAILGFNTRRYQKWITYLQSAPTLNCLKPREKLAGGPDMVITDHSKVSAYPLQWGSLGNIVCMRKLWWSRSEPDSQCTIMPRLPDGGMEVLTNFEGAITEKLRQDPELGHFLKFRCQ